MFPPDKRVALACQRFESRAVEHDDAAAGVMNQTRVLKRSHGFGDALAAHAQHIGSQLEKV